MARIAVVIPTYGDHKADLVRCVDALSLQSHVPDLVIIVKNGKISYNMTDVLDQFRERLAFYVIEHNENLGSAGGFAAGIEEGVRQSAEWIWLLDHDAYPSPGALAALIVAVESLKEQAVGALYSVHVSPDGSREYFGGVWLGHAFHRKDPTLYYEIDVVGYSGLFLRTKVVQEVGLPKKEFFSWFDDYEYCLRIKSSGFKIFGVRNSICFHQPGVVVPGKGVRLHHMLPWKHYYDARNSLYWAWRHGLYDLMVQVGRTLMWCAVLLWWKDWESLRMRIRGVKHAFEGKLGKIENVY